jgi:AI-2 transport protein TqsA
MSPSEHPPTQSSNERDVQTVCLLILAVMAVGVGLFLLKALLLPFVLAVFFTYCLTPIIDLQTRRWGMPQGLAIVGAGVVGVLILVLLGYIVTVSVAQMYTMFTDYQQRLTELGQDVMARLPLSQWGIDPHRGTTLLTLTEEDRRRLLTAVLSELSDHVSRGGLVIVFMIFLLLGRKKGEVRSGILAEIETRVKRFVTRVVFFSALTGVLVWLALVIAGLSAAVALVFGFLAFLLNFIPSLGSVIATLLPIPVILLSPDLSVTQKVLAIVLPTAVQAGMGVLQPKYLGDSLGLHPVAVVMALIFFGMIWGTVGAFLAAPMMAVVKIILEKNSPTRPLADLLGGDLTALSGPAPAEVSPTAPPEAK